MLPVLAVYCNVLLFVDAGRYEVQEEDSERMNLPVYFRERHSKHVGSASSTLLFGQPLLISVPRHNLIADVLYDKIMERIG